MAQRVGPEGKVYSTEIEPKLLEKIRSNAQKAGTSNLVVVVGTEHATGLPPDCCDAVLLREVYHHLTDPISMDDGLYEATRSGARLAIIDFEPTPVAGPALQGVPTNRGGHGVPERIVAEEFDSGWIPICKDGGLADQRFNQALLYAVQKASLGTTEQNGSQVIATETLASASASHRGGVIYLCFKRGSSELVQLAS